MSYPRLAAVAFAAVAGMAAAAAELPVGNSLLTAPQCAADFDAMWKAVDQGYAYFGSTRSTWRRARDTWRPKAAAAASRTACAVALGSALETLRDDAVRLSGEGIVTPRRIPAETDIWARLDGDRAIVTGVRAGSPADVAGAYPGLAVHSIQGVTVERAVRERLGSATANPEAKTWALNHLLAGPRSGTYLLGVRGHSPKRTLEIARAEEPNGGMPLVARKIGEDRDLGYLRLKNTLGDAGMVMNFDAALMHLKDTRALILDLRETFGGGSEEVVQAVLGRFVEAPTPWQVREPRGQPRVTDSVAPRGPFTYRGPVVVLVDRWTAAEGEVLAAGLVGATRATLIGTEMAGLRGKSRDVTLKHTGFVVRYPAEKAFDVAGTPREQLRPNVPVDLAAPSGGPGDPILYQALKHLEKKR